MEEGMMSGFCVRTSAGVGGGKYCVRSSSKGSMSTSTTNGSGTKCGRWNPTAEQVKVLTELFRSGLRTPTTDQIQKISTQLSFYGKIESKNVFYWFQNHKARERQKRRKVSFHDSNNNNLLITTTSDKENCFNLSTQRFGEMYQQVSKPDRVIETLQLFPVNSFGESESENNTHKLRVHANDHHQYHCRVDDVMFSSYTMAEQMEHPPLDLRLSFM